MNARPDRRRRGFTLVEALIAGAILSLLALSLLEGIGVASRIVEENAEYLAADAVAFDLAYKRSRENFNDLMNLLSRCASLPNRELVETISSNACPVLCRLAPESRTRVEHARDASGNVDTTALAISVDVAWGPDDNRRLLSSRFGPACIVKSSIGLRE